MEEFLFDYFVFQYLIQFKRKITMANTIAKQRWYRFIPIAFITYSLAYLDRANFGFAAQAEWRKT